ncbi:MAG: phosphoribosylanthranilate isomerase [Ginsengibacter sp.]
MKFKVCGITQIEQLNQLDALGVDYAGLIFYSRSVRYVLNKLRSEDVRSLDLSLQKVGVFVNASEEDILSQVELYGLDIVQLHGDETPAFCNHISHHVSVIKAFRITQKNEQNIDWMVKPYEEFCDYYLFDTNRKGAYGGTGEKFDWEILKRNKIHKNFFLSGGIGIDDIERIKNFEHPFFFAIDINSRVEVEDGIKDIPLVSEFVNELSTK